MAIEDPSSHRLSRRKPHWHLSAGAIKHFYQAGFLVIPGVFTPREVRLISLATDRLKATAYRLGQTQLHQGTQFVLGTLGSKGSGQAKVQIQRVVWAGSCEPALSAFGQDPRLVSLAAQLLGSPVLEQLINQVHFKEPGDGVAFEWHQDSRHRRYGTDQWRDLNGAGSFVELITAIDAMGPHNGGLKVIPGSALFGHIEPIADGRSLPPGSFNPDAAICPLLAAGDVLCLHPFTIHGSGRNESKGPRRLFLNGFALPGANHRQYPGKGAGRRVCQSPQPV